MDGGLLDIGPVEIFGGGEGALGEQGELVTRRAGIAAETRGDGRSCVGVTLRAIVVEADVQTAL